MYNKDGCLYKYRRKIKFNIPLPNNGCINKLDEIDTEFALCKFTFKKMIDHYYLDGVKISAKTFNDNYGLTKIKEGADLDILALFFGKFYGIL
jgi:hypothetical protein